MVTFRPRSDKLKDYGLPSSSLKDVDWGVIGIHHSTPRLIKIMVTWRTGGWGETRELL